MVCVIILLLEQMLNSVQQAFVIHLYFIILTSVLAVLLDCYTEEIVGKGRAVDTKDFVAPFYDLESAN